MLTHTYYVFKASDLYLPKFPTDCDTEKYAMSHGAGNRRGKEGGNVNETEISLKRDQWSRVEKRLIELKGGEEKRIKPRWRRA